MFATFIPDVVISYFWNSLQRLSYYIFSTALLTNVCSPNLQCCYSLSFNYNYLQPRYPRICNIGPNSSTKVKLLSSVIAISWLGVQYADNSLLANNDCSSVYEFYSFCSYLDQIRSYEIWDKPKLLLFFNLKRSSIFQSYPLGQLDSIWLRPHRPSY